MSKVGIHVVSDGPGGVFSESSCYQCGGTPGAPTLLELDPGLIVSWHAREGGGVWATVRLPLLQTMEEMVALVGVRDDDTMPEEEA